MYCVNLTRIDTKHQPRRAHTESGRSLVNTRKSVRLNRDAALIGEATENCVLSLDRNDTIDRAEAKKEL